MADVFENPDFEVNSEEMADDQFAYMEEGFPGWVPAAGNLDTWLLEAGARTGSEVATLALLVTPEIFRVYGEKVIRLLPVDDASASATSTWTLGDDNGHVIPAGTVVTIDGVAFETVADAVVPNSETVVAGVGLVAIDEGSVGNNLTAPVEVVDVLGYDVVSVVLDAPTDGGIDGESDDDYIDRLAREAELFAPRPLTARDVELFSQRVLGIDRAAVLDNYKPGPPYDSTAAANDVPLVFTVVPIDETGQPANAAAQDELATILQDNRGTNWRIFLIEPTYTAFDVTFAGKAHREFDPDAVELAAIDAVRNYLSPDSWGQPLYGEARRWVNTTKVRHRELAAALERVEGLAYLTSLQFNINGVALTENVDVDLPGVAPLPTPGTINGDVTGL